MPFLHEGSNVSITQVDNFHSRKPSSLNSRNISSTERLHRIIQREASAGNQNLQNQIAQRRAAQRKLQMAKMMGNGGMSAVALQFQREHHSSNSNSREQNDPMFVASRRARSNNFTLKETFDLLKIWASPEMQWQMKHNFRNFRVWEAISFSMHEMGHDRTAIQCKNRIQNLTSIFYRIKKSKQDYRSFNFPYYKLIGDVLDGKKNGTTSITPPPGVSSMVNGSFTPNRESGMNVSPTSQNAAGFAAHLGLVEEYQRLINPDYMTPPGRSSSNNSNSGLNVLSPEISLRVEGNSDDEGSSPSRIDTSQPSRSSNSLSAASVQKNAISSRNGNNSTTAGGSSILKQEQDDSVTVTVDETANTSELDHGDNMEDDLEESEQLLQDAEDCRSDELIAGSYSSAPRTKRSFSSASFGQSGGLKFGHPSKRPRVGSLSGHSMSALMEDQPSFASEVLDIERERLELDRQWLALERERAENEKAWMIMDSERAENDRQLIHCMIQCMGQFFGINQEDDDNGEQQENEHDNENENDNEHEQDLEGNGYQEEHDQDQNEENESEEIHKMIEENGVADEQE